MDFSNLPDHFFPNSEPAYEVRGEDLLEVPLSESQTEPFVTESERVESSIKSRNTLSTSANDEVQMESQEKL